MAVHCPVHEAERDSGGGDDDVGYPLHQEHAAQTEEASEKRNPRVEIFERRSPTLTLFGPNFAALGQNRMAAPPLFCIIFFESHLHHSARYKAMKGLKRPELLMMLS